MAHRAKKPAGVEKKTGRAVNAKKAGKAGISKDMRVIEILSLLPEAEPVLAQYGLHCFHCSANVAETLEEGCASHGFTTEDIDDLVTDLNELLGSRPDRPEFLTVTLPAAENLSSIAAAEGKADYVLVVGVDELGGFCMEFSPEPPPSALSFFHPDLPAMKLFATTLTLSRIGGATIDYREGRFKLDLPEADVATEKCACGKGTCGCS